MPYARISLVALLATTASLLAVPTVSSPASAVSLSTVVSAIPVTNTPDVTDGAVYAIAQAGSTVVLGGDFSAIALHGSGAPTPAPSLAAYDIGTGALISGFAPTLNGVVRTIVAGPTVDTVYVGGDFTTIDGVPSRIALISTVTGDIVPGWTSPKSNGTINTIVPEGNRLFVGGDFTSISGHPHVGLAVLNPTSGTLSAYATPSFTGHHNYGRLCDPTTADCVSARTGIRSMDIDPSGTRLVAVGNFTNVDGVTRDQLALLDLGSSAATLTTTWATYAYTAECDGSTNDSYVRQVQFSPDGSYFVVVATGGGGFSQNGDGTFSSCDAVDRFETNASGANVHPTWIDRTGNDTLWSVAVTGAAIYVGGHNRWLNNSVGPNSAAEGAAPRPGIAALDPLSGLPFSWNPGRNPRGGGAYALLATADGLYVGSDTNYIGNYQYLHKKIAFFPLAGGTSTPPDSSYRLPGHVTLLGGAASGGSGLSVAWNGLGAPASTTVLSGNDWSTTHGAFEVDDIVYYGDVDGNFYRRSFDGTTFGSATAIDPYDDPTWDDVQTGSGQTYQGVKSNFYGEIPTLTSMFYSNGRLFYTKSGDSHMYWRWFEPDSGVTGAEEFTTQDAINWSNVAGAFLSGSTLYYADATTGVLNKVTFGVAKAIGTPSVASTAINWASVGAFVSASDPRPPNDPPTAAFTVKCTGLTCHVDASASTDTDGSIASYRWSWGDGTTTEAATPTTSHPYTAAGRYAVTLTVTDNDGAPDTVKHSVKVSQADTTTPGFVGASTANRHSRTISVKVPAKASKHDAQLLFVSYSSHMSIAAVGKSWAKVGQTHGAGFDSAVYRRMGHGLAAGRVVRVTFPHKVQAALTLADYSHAKPKPTVARSAASANKRVHRSPAVTVKFPNSLVLSYWTDRSNSTRSWSLPSTVTRRSESFGKGSGVISDVLADAATPVGARYGGVVATASGFGVAAAAWTIALGPRG